MVTAEPLYVRSSPLFRSCGYAPCFQCFSPCALLPYYIYYIPCRRVVKGEPRGARGGRTHGPSRTWADSLRLPCYYTRYSISLIQIKLSLCAIPPENYDASLVLWDGVQMVNRRDARLLDFVRLRFTSWEGDALGSAKS